MLILRYLLHLLPHSVRILIVKTILDLPLWLSRIVLILAKRPIGDEWKWIHKVEQNTWKGVWIVPNLKTLKHAEVDASLNHDLVVLYNHGGAYCKGHPKMYMETFQLIINHLRNEHNMRASILSLDYSLSPENVWPKAIDEALEAYRYLTETIGIPPSKIIFAGDSAGGNLVAVLMLAIKEQKNLSQPAGAALLSPCVDLTLDQPSFAIYKDDFIDPTHAPLYLSYYMPNYHHLNEEQRVSMIRHPLISPVFGDFKGTCPTFIAYGDKELLRASIEKFKLNLENDGVNVTTLKGENELHDWLVERLISSSKQVYEKDCKTMIDWMASVIVK